MTLFSAKGECSRSEPAYLALGPPIQGKGYCGREVLTDGDGLIPFTANTW